MSIKPITPEAFEPYGWVIAHDPAGERFQVVCGDPDPDGGWQIAVNRESRTAVEELARHPNTMESFEPLEGLACLIVARPDTPEVQEVFLLDRPVCLKKGVWHATVCIASLALIKITENGRVESEFHKLPAPLEIFPAAGLEGDG